VATPPLYVLDDRQLLAYWREGDWELHPFSVPIPIASITISSLACWRTGVGGGAPPPFPPLSCALQYKPVSRLSWSWPLLLASYLASSLANINTTFVIFLLSAPCVALANGYAG
jgi:hypothetical protein